MNHAGTARTGAIAGAIGAALVLTLAGMAPAAANEAPSTSTQAATSLTALAPAATVRYTTLTFVLDNCSGCRITSVVRALQVGSRVRPSRPTFWVARGLHKVRTNIYQVKVPTAYTPGLSFTIDASWRGRGGTLGYVVNVATRYTGHRVGAVVTSSQATHARSGYGCWAGTSRSSYVIHVSARRFTARSYEGRWVYDLIAWSTRGLPSVGKPTTALGNQDAFYC
jgi:hypothetical protein